LASSALSNKKESSSKSSEEGRRYVMADKVVKKAGRRLSTTTLNTLMVAEALVEGSLNNRLYRLCRLAVASNRGPFCHVGSKIRIKMDITINAADMATTSSGLILTPLVSSSKKRSSPALEAGRGACFFLL
jgi:hypothetical protein